MKQVIRLLPDNIANQIAAGEVVQRPASVVKELLENAVDAGATNIELLIKDAGKALIQVIDNGSGMSAQDARMAFERHATSKIRASEDLFNIRTMGFRGEAMASIAAVAQVNLKTRLHDAELGTELVIEGSDIKGQEPCMTAVGTCVSVKNLFFNVPARRNFLKSNPVETRHILNEFMRVAMAQPELAMRMEHNGSLIFDLEPGALEDRLVQLFGKTVDGKLVAVDEDTPYVGIGGFIGMPEAARRKRGDQYFFVNRRFIKSGYLNHALKTAYEGLIPDDTYPFYCIFFDIDPKHVDINIHPTKTEIKFDDERTVYQLLHSVIRKGLGELHLASVTDASEDQGFLKLLSQVPLPQVEVEETIGSQRTTATGLGQSQQSSWDDLYPKMRNQESGSRKQEPKRYLPPELPTTANLFDGTPVAAAGALSQFGNRYILSQEGHGLLIIDQCHAHQRVLFEQFRDAETHPPLASQQLLFPRTLSFSAMDFSYLREIETQVRHLGFDLREFGENSYILHGVPSALKGTKAEQFFEDIIAEVRETGDEDVKTRIFERLARSIAGKSAMQAGKRLNQQEMRNLVDTLMQCEEPARSPFGKPTYFRLELKDLAQHFQRKS